MRGGPAKAAVVSSGLLGSVSGSAVANVMSTGIFTIPLMQKVGYTARFAGAVEAAASTGGQLVPPVMGAAAFIVADYLRVPYQEVVLAAILPAVAYYLALLLMVDLSVDRGERCTRCTGKQPDPRDTGTRSDLEDVHGTGGGSDDRCLRADGG